MKRTEAGVETAGAAEGRGGRRGKKPARPFTSLDSNAGLCLGILAGLAAGIFGILVGALLGFMIDTVRSEMRLRAWLASPGSRRAPDEALPGLVATLALTSFAAPSLGHDRRRALIEPLLESILRPLGRLRRLVHRPWPTAILAVLEGETEMDREGLSRQLAAHASRETKLFLARALWLVEAATHEILSRERERLLATLLLEAGLGLEDIHREREAVYPGWTSPWELLGLEEGAPPEEIRKAWRLVSKRLHPDSSAGADAERFIEAKEAYSVLMASVEQPSVQGDESS